VLDEPPVDHLVQPVGAVGEPAVPQLGPPAQGLPDPLAGITEMTQALLPGQPKPPEA